MKQISIINSCTLNPGAVAVTIGGGGIYKVKRGKIKTINLPEGKYKIRVEQYWTSGEREIVVGNSDVELTIKRVIPEYLYAFALGILIALYVLYFTSVISVVVPSVYTIIVVLFMMYTSTFLAKKHFRISISV